MATGKLVCVTCMVEMYTYVQVEDEDDPIEVAKRVDDWRRTLNLPASEFKVVDPSELHLRVFPSRRQQCQF